MADPEVQEANEQLDRDAAMADDEFLGEGDEPATERFADIARAGIELAAADTDVYETVGAAS